MQMLSNRSSQSNRWYLSYTQKLHQKKLKEIKDKGSSLVDNRVPESQKILPLLRKGTKEQQNVGIQKENLILLGRLASISCKRNKYMTVPPSLKSGPLSLNFLARKKEAERISDENEYLVKRLKEVPSNIPRVRKLKPLNRPNPRNLSKSEKHLGFSAENKQ